MKSASPDKINLLLVNLLRPIARLALDRGMKHQDLLVALKQALVESARENLSAPECTISRISVLTGLHRYDVKKIDEAEHTHEDSDPRSLTARVLSRWATNSAYCDSRGRARALSCDGKNSEFAQLVSEVSQAVNPYTVLFDLERLKLVERSELGLVLKSRLFVDRENEHSGLSLLAADSTDLHQSVSENLFTEAEFPNLHIRTEFDNIPESELPKLRVWLLKIGTRFHERVQRYLAKFDRDDRSPSTKIGQQGNGAKICLTSFSITRLPVSAEASQEKLVRSSKG